MRSLYCTFAASWLAVVAVTCPAVAQVQAPVAIDPGSQTIVIDSAPAGFVEGGGGGLIRPWGGIEYHSGPGIGYNHGFESVEGFVPVFVGDGSVVFADLRAIESDTGFFGANAGGGYRFLAPAMDRIFGVNAYFDNRSTGDHSFNQVGFGFECLGSLWDLRGNVYLPVGSRERETAAIFNNPAFVEHFILLGHTGLEQSALRGFDVEAGAPVPVLDRFGLKAYIGAYDFQGAGSPQAWGVKGRLEERVLDGLTLNANVTNDRVFGTTASVDVEVRFGSREARSGSARGETYARLIDRVERLDNIVVTNQLRTSSVLAIDPATGQPIFVEHVDSNAGAGGDGTVEHPFQTLAQIQAASAPHEILFAHANSVFVNQLIVLQPNQRFLGEGIPHLFTATQGTFLLPRATTGTAIPVITGAPGNAVTLANFDEVSGFTIVQSHEIGVVGGNGIFGSAVTGFDINRNTITMSDLNGIRLTLINGSGSLTGNTITANGINGVQIDGTSISMPVSGNNISSNTNFGYVLAATTVSGDYTGNTTNSNGNDGLNVTATAGAVNSSFVGNVADLNRNFGINVSGTSVTGNVANNEVVNNGNDGFRVGGGNGTSGQANVTTGAFNGSVTGNVATSNRNFGINVLAASVTGDIANNTATANGNDGIHVLATTGPINGNVTGNIASNNTNFGIEIAANTGSLTGNVTGNTAFSNGNDGVSLTIAGAMTGNVAGNVAGSNQVNGLDVRVGGAMNGSVTNNTTSNNNGTDGISLTVGGAMSGAIANNMASNNHVSGLAVTIGGAYTGAVTGNTTSSNAGFDGISLTVGGAMSGDIANNTATSNHVSGLDVTIGGAYTGNVTNNVASGNAGFDGIHMVIGGSMTGNVSGNNASNNETNGLDFTVSGTFTGNVANNIASGNTSAHGNDGILFAAAHFNGNVSGNTTTGNFDRGTFLTINGGVGTSTIGVFDNSFAGNNNNDSQFQLNNGPGAGTVSLTLNGNTASPPVQATPGNYTFFSNGGLITVHDGTNVGSIQSSGNVTVGP